MAQKTMTILEDDIDGGEAQQTVSFSLDGTSYEIDLNDKNASALRDAFSSWVGHARKASGSRSSAAAPRRMSAAKKSTSSGGSDTAAVREWARSNGYTVPDRGRIKGDILEAYAKANA